MQAAEAYVNTVRIPGTKLSLRKLGFSGLPYLMPRDTLGNRAAAKVCDLNRVSRRSDEHMWQPESTGTGIRPCAAGRTGRRADQSLHALHAA